MSLDLSIFQDPDLSDDHLGHLLDEQAPRNEAFHQRLWNYYRNPLVPASAFGGATNENSRPYFLAQEVGLPARITGVQRNPAAGECLTDLRRKEVVIENDIAWRVQTMVDFLFGQAPSIRSLADDPARAERIEQTLAALFDANGGLSLLQEMALFGSVYGFVDIALRIPADWSARRLSVASLRAPSAPADAPAGPSPAGQPGASLQSSSADQDVAGDSAGARSKPDMERVVQRARMLRLETVEAPRILPILAEDDYRRCRYWVQRFFVRRNRPEPARRGWRRRGRVEAAPQEVEVVEIIGPRHWQRYEDRRLVAQGPNEMGRIPVVHIQNQPLAGQYAGLSDVEPLIPLQDELNTRLSDRAHRVTYQSFRMYLGKGIEDFLERPVAPGQMWATQNLQAGIEEFGTDSGSPSEDVHIDQVRQALDKTSGVTPLAAGLLRDNLGHLSSATALKVVLSGLLAKTQRKRLTYGEGIARIADLALDWLDRTGVLPTRPSERRIELHWPSPLPEDESRRLRDAQLKRQLGVPADRILAELGYGEQD
jgi:hypothetical protein